MRIRLRLQPRCFRAVVRAPGLCKGDEEVLLRLRFHLAAALLAQRLQGHLQAANVGDVLAQRQVSVQLRVVHRGVRVVLLGHAFGALVERVAYVLRPPFVQVAVPVELPALIVEAVGQLMAGDHSQAAVVRRLRSSRLEERCLHDSGEEYHLVQRGIVVRVHRHGAELEVVAIDGLADLVQIALGLEARRLVQIRQQRLLPDVHARVVAPFLRIGDLVVDLLQLVLRRGPSRFVHPRHLGQVALEGALDAFDDLAGDLLSFVADGGGDEAAPDGLAHRIVGHLHAAFPARQDGLGARQSLGQAKLLLDEALSQRVGGALHRGPAQVGSHVVELRRLGDEAPGPQPDEAVERFIAWRATSAHSSCQGRPIWRADSWCGRPPCRDAASRASSGRASPSAAHSFSPRARPTRPDPHEPRVRLGRLRQLRRPQTPART